MPVSFELDHYEPYFPPPLPCCLFPVAPMIVLLAIYVNAYAFSHVVHCYLGAAGGDTSMIRQAMERAMLAAVAAQMGLPEDDPAVVEVLARESRHMGRAGGSV